MNSFVIPLLAAVPPAGADQTGGAFFSTLLPFALIFGIMYLLIFRPQSKRRKEAEKMIAALKKGDKIVTIGGIHGTVQGVKETTVIVKVDDNVKLEFLRSAVANVVTQGKEEKIEESSGESSESGE